MNKKKTPWYLAATVLTFVLVLTFMAPAVFAQNTDPETQRLLNMFQQVFSFVENNYVDQVEPKVLMEGALKGLFESLKDPHSAYLTADDMRALTDTTAGEFGGVGLYINKQTPKEQGGRKLPAYVEVVAPIEDTPAYRAGIIAGDLITKVDGQAVDDLAIDDVISKLRGPAGSMVTVTIKRSETVIFDVKLNRAIIQVPTVKYAMMPDGVALLRIIQFTPFTAPKVQEAVDFFKSKNYTRMVIDLRSNPGGLLNSVVETADFFFDDGLIVSTKSRLARENVSFEATKGTIVPPDVPIAILIDGGSASAAEIFSGVMKDRHRATLFGTKTYGKGSVQQVKSLGTGGFRLTMSRYYTPSGVTIDKVGIAPDKEVKDPEMSEPELAAYTKLIQDSTIADFAKTQPSPTDPQIAAFIAKLKAGNPVYSDTVLRRMIRNEVNRHLSSPPIFDLDYDTVLKEAVKFLGSAKQSAGKSDAAGTGSVK
jgi:carboxyl-terminal processing protease